MDNIIKVNKLINYSLMMYLCKYILKYIYKYQHQLEEYNK